jgi:drug/metabolite transporter (DMT)-like permease
VAARYLSAAEVALIGLSENLFGPLWAWLGAGEVITRQALAGGTVVLSALVLNIVGSRAMRRAGALARRWR